MHAVSHIYLNISVYHITPTWCVFFSREILWDNHFFEEKAWSHDFDGFWVVLENSR